MVDLSKLKKGGGKTPDNAPPAPPGPGSDMDLPAPAPPAQSPGKPEQQPPQAPAESSDSPPGPPSPEEVMAKVAGGPDPSQAPKQRGIEAVKPLEMPRQVSHSKPEHGVDPSEAVDIQGSPPVFIKIDKYTEIVKNLGKLKSYALSLRDALDALADIEKELTTGISIAHKALDDFNTIISILDSKLLRASAIKDADVSSPGDVDKYIKGIYDQMEKIKAELRAV